MKKEEILQASTAQFMRLGAKSVSMDDIASLIGISKKTLYQFFENKEDLISQSLQSFMYLEQQFLNEIRKTANDALDEMIQLGRHHVSIVRNMSPSMTFDLKKYYPKVWKMIKDFNDQFVGEMIITNLKNGITEGLYRENMNPPIIAKLFRLKSWSIVDRTHFSIEEYRQDELVKEHLLYHLNGILSDQGKEQIKKYELF